MEIKLPEPVVDSTFSLEKSLSLRRSVRQYTQAPLPVSKVGQLLWAAQGITTLMDTVLLLQQEPCILLNFSWW